MSGATSGAFTGATVGTAISPGVGSLLGAAAGGLLGLAADTWSSDRSREMDQEDYQENQLQNFMYSQQAQRNAASNGVAGLMKAGLNPALAGGANAAPMVGAPMQNKEAPKFNPGMAQLLSGLALQKAQTENIEAQTENIEQKTGEAKTAGLTASFNLENHFSVLAANTSDKNLKDFYESMAIESKNAGVFAKAAQDSLQAFQQLKAESYESVERILKARLSALITESQFNKALPHGEYLEKLTDLPQKQFDKLTQEIARLMAEKKNLEALETLYLSSSKLNDKQIEQVDAMAKKLQSYNIPELIKSGDSAGALAAFFGIMLEAIAGLPGHFTVSSSNSTSQSTVTKR